MGLAKACAWAPATSAAGWGGPLGREPRGDVLGALDLLRVPLVIHLIGRPGRARRLRAGFGGFPVGFLQDMTEPAARAETHSAAPSPGKISVTHKLIGLSIEIHILQHAHGDQRAEH